MNVDTGEVGLLEKLEASKQKGERLVPVPSDEKLRSTISNWGRKKRNRYRELLAKGASVSEAYVSVEYNRGVQIEKSKR